MGNIVGGIIGGLGSVLGGQSAKSNDLTGYNYLTGKNGTQGYVNSGNQANTAQSDLLGLNGAAGAARSGPAFQSYLNSTGYNFQQDQGTRALTGSAAARGLLNSGSTAKALTGFGEGLASEGFNNYLTNVGGVANRGLTAADQIGQAGTAGGARAGDAMQTGTTNFFGKLAGAAATFL